MTIYKVVVVTISDTLSPDDEDLPGVYEFDVTGDGNPFDAVLDEFHSEHGIEQVDDFIIYVLDGDDEIMDPSEEEADPDCHAEYLGKTSDEVPAWLLKDVSFRLSNKP